MRSTLRRLRLAVPLAFAVTTADCTSKQLAVEHLTPGDHHEVLGEVVQLTLVYNRGAAMGIPLGPYAKPILLTAGLVILALLGRMLLTTRLNDVPQRVALGLLLGGALGNYFSRLLSPGGVVDFINVGVGPYRFWIFNFADIAVFCGAVLFVLVLWKTDRRRSPSRPV